MHQPKCGAAVRVHEGSDPADFLSINRCDVRPDRFNVVLIMSLQRLPRMSSGWALLTNQGGTFNTLMLRPTSVFGNALSWRENPLSFIAGVADHGLAHEAKVEPRLSRQNPVPRDGFGRITADRVMWTVKDEAVVRTVVNTN